LKRKLEDKRFCTEW